MTTDTSRGPTAILAALLEARTGQALSPSRQWRIEASLKPVMRSHGIDSLDQLVGKLVGNAQPTLAQDVIEALLNNETSFFRDAQTFQQLDHDVLETLRDARGATRRLRIWSAACSTGQEAYSIAMMLRDDLRRWAGWTIEILATDVSATTVARGRAGRFSSFEIQRGLPVRTMLRWFKQDGEDWVAKPELRSAVRFAEHNLVDPAPQRFDLILCRNVLMYLAPPLKLRVFDRMADALDPQGVLVLGAGETVIGQTTRFASHPQLRGFYVAATEVPSSKARAAAR